LAELAEGDYKKVKASVSYSAVGMRKREIDFVGVEMEVCNFGSGLVVVQSSGPGRAVVRNLVVDSRCVEESEGSGEEVPFALTQAWAWVDDQVLIP
jgi:hypothetical protein